MPSQCGKVSYGSDAEAKGLKPGDEVLAINGFPPTRQNMWQIDYVFHTLRPVLTLRLDLRAPDGNTRQVEAAAKFRELSRVKELSGAGSDNIWEIFRAAEDERHYSRARWTESGNDLMILKLPVFDFSQSEVDDV